MEERAHTIRRMFSSISAKYDMLNHLLSAGIDCQWRKIVADLLVDHDTARVLDVCTGTGDLVFAIARKMRRGSVVGTDFSGKMLRIGQVKNERHDLAVPVLFLESDALRLPFQSDTFDGVTIAFGLRNLVDWRAGLVEMARVLRPGGKLAILEFSLPQRQPLRSLYLTYFTRILPLIGNIFTRTNAYSYLTRSVVEWPSPHKLAESMREAGFANVKIRRLTGGIACVHLGVLLSK